MDQETTSICYKPETMIQKLASYQSNKREYIVLAKPSLLTVAAWGSRLLLMISSGVIITRLRSASSNEGGSHLKQDQLICKLNMKMTSKPNHISMKVHSYMRSSAVIWRWNWDCSSFKTAESLSSSFAKLILPRWRIAATTLKIASWERD